MLPPFSPDVLDEPGPLISQDGSPVWTDDEYPDYDATQTFVISGPIGNAKFRGRRFGSWRAARIWLTATHTVVKFGCVPVDGRAARWIARVAKRSVQ